MFRKSKDVIIESAKCMLMLANFFYVSLALFDIPVATINNHVLVNALVPRRLS